MFFVTVICVRGEKVAAKAVIRVNVGANLESW